MPVVKNKDFEHAVAILEEARQGDGCMCQRCQNDRVHAAEPYAFILVYPELKFTPEGISYFCYDEGYGRLSYIERIRRGNTAKREAWEGKKGRLFFCRWCGKLHSARQSTKHQGNRYCSECMRVIYFCVDCKKTKYNDDRFTVRTPNGDSVYVCRDCYKKLYSSCNSCANSYKKDTLKEFSYGRNEGGHLKSICVCARCEKADSLTCEFCRRTTQKSICILKGDRYYCPVCAEVEKGLHQYYYKPLVFNFKADSREGVVSQSAFHMGFELEVAAFSSFVGVEAMTFMVKDQVGKHSAYCMNDGTIQRETGHKGMEVVTHPFTWQRYKKQDTAKWDKLLLFLRSKGWKANLPGIGFHVHTTKSAWGSHQIYKLLHLIYENQPFILKIAQREPTKHCVMSEADFDDAVLVAKDKKNRQRDHYSTLT